MVLQKETWLNKTHLYAAMTTTLIGIRNFIWSPYFMYVHGAIPFVLCYLLVMAIISFPVLYVEAMLSQFTHSGNRGVFNCCPLFRGVSYSMAFFTVMVNIPLYTTVSTALLYFLRSLEEVPPWATCTGSWVRDTNSCYVPKQGAVSCEIVGRVLARAYCDQNEQDGYPVLYRNKIIMVPADVFNNHSKDCISGNSSSVYIFFNDAVLNIGTGIYDIFGLEVNLVFVSAVLFLLIFALLYEGFIKLRYTFYIISVLQYLLLLLMWGISMSVPTADTEELFGWRWDVFYNVVLWQDVILYATYGMGLGGYGLMYITSHNGFQNNYLRDIVFVLSIDFVTSILCGTVVLRILAYDSAVTGLHLDQIITSNVAEDALFVDIPEAIMNMSSPELVSSVYFLLLFVMGIGTLFLTTEIVIEVITEEYPHSYFDKRGIRATVTCVCYLGNLFFLTPAGPYLNLIVRSYLFYFVGSINIILEMIVIFQFYGLQRVLIDAEMMLDRQPGKVIQILWTAVVPLVLAITLVFSMLLRPSARFRDYEYPIAAKIIASALVVINLSFIPSYAYSILSANDYNVDKVRRHATRWRPADPAFAREYKSRLVSKGLFIRHHRRDSKAEGKQPTAAMSTGMFVPQNE
ncbi:sodium-dependent nutrient amino acid transporter 1-like [Ornithodoros turicata]|uniref:sodium-dependent nutrient amino acid transporter 1-like n=1 Tax=Ornithodoros turicata TaxID=34597 RepID=UPI003138C7D2